jgi:hypothetical protein
VVVAPGNRPELAQHSSGDGVAANFTSTFTTNAPVQPAASAGPAKNGAERSAVTFAGSATGGTGSLTYAWDFGDGMTGSGALTPSHVYDVAGTYAVTLTVTDALRLSSQRWSRCACTRAMSR